MHVDAMITWIEEDCTITLKSIKERLYQDFDVTVSLQCLSEHLNAQLFTYKCVHVPPISANSDNNKQKRKEFVEQLLNYQSEEKIIVYMDETNVNLFCKRSYGRAIAEEIEQEEWMVIVEGPICTSLPQCLSMA